MENITVIRSYNDCTTATEKAPDIVSALSAAAIYLNDKECWTVKIIVNGKIVMNYYRPE